MKSGANAPFFDRVSQPVDCYPTLRLKGSASKEMTITTENSLSPPCGPLSLEQGTLIGQKRPLKPKDVWTIRVRLQVDGRRRDLATFNQVARGPRHVGFRFKPLVS